ncbi:MAG: hypothetical protein ACXWMX_04560, partial [Candidatus Limnocylindrales bacterium]
MNERADPLLGGSARAAQDPVLVALRRSLVTHRRRLWFRRIVRRAWFALAALLAAEVTLAGLARLVALEEAP